MSANFELFKKITLDELLFQKPSGDTIEVIVQDQLFRKVKETRSQQWTQSLLLPTTFSIISSNTCLLLPPIDRFVTD